MPFFLHPPSLSLSSPSLYPSIHAQSEYGEYYRLAWQLGKYNLGHQCCVRRVCQCAWVRERERRREWRRVYRTAGERIKKLLQLYYTHECTLWFLLFFLLPPNPTLISLSPQSVFNPEQIVYSSNHSRGEIVNLTQLGDQVIASFVIRSSGPSVVPTVEFTLFWPLDGMETTADNRYYYLYPAAISSVQLKKDSGTISYSEL